MARLSPEDRLIERQMRENQRKLEKAQQDAKRDADRALQAQQALLDQQRRDAEARARLVQQQIAEVERAERNRLEQIAKSQQRRYGRRGEGPLHIFGHTDRAIAIEAADKMRRFMIRGIGIGGVDAAKAVSKQLQLLAKIMDQPRVDAGKRTQLHETIAKRGQQAILNSYAQTVTARKRAPSYRFGAGRFGRYSNDSLRDAIRSPKFYRAYPQGLDFINTEYLDLVAKHWHRLNFGAAPAGGGSHFRVAVKWSNLVVASMGFDEPASPSFAIPGGFWTESGQFYPYGSRIPRNSGSLKRQDPRATRGIVARHFLDAGVRAVAREIGPAYQDYIEELHQRFRRGEGPLTRGGLGPIRLTPQSIEVFTP